MNHKKATERRALHPSVAIILTNFTQQIYSARSVKRLNATTVSSLSAALR